MPNLTPEDRESFEEFIETLNKGNGMEAGEYILNLAAEIADHCGPDVDLPRHMGLLRDWYEDVQSEMTKIDEGA